MIIVKVKNAMGDDIHETSYKTWCSAEDSAVAWESLNETFGGPYEVIVYEDRTQKYEAAARPTIYETA